MRRERQREAEVRRAGAFEINLIEPRLGQAPVGEEAASVNPSAQVGDDAIFRGPKEAGQPCHTGGKAPGGGMDLDGELPLRSLDDHARPAKARQRGRPVNVKVAGAWERRRGTFNHGRHGSGTDGMDRVRVLKWSANRHWLFRKGQKEVFSLPVTSRAAHASGQS